MRVRISHFQSAVQGVDRNRGGSDKRPDRLELESDLDGVEGKEMRPMSQHRYSNRSRELRHALLLSRLPPFFHLFLSYGGIKAIM